MRLMRPCRRGKASAPALYAANMPPTLLPADEATEERRDISSVGVKDWAVVEIG